MGLFGNLFGRGESEIRLREFQTICHSYDEYQKLFKSNAVILFSRRKAYLEVIAKTIQSLASIEALPDWCAKEVQKINEEISAFRTAVQYEKHPAEFAKMTDVTGRTSSYLESGTSASEAIKKIGATAAMAIATVTGTVFSRSALTATTSAAATNAALAWLGGGSIIAGVGVAGGTTILGLFGPVGLTAAVLGTGIGTAYKWMKNDKDVQEITQNIEAIRHDTHILLRQCSRLSILMERSENAYTARLLPCRSWLETVNPKDYRQWNEEQKHKLEELFNALSITTQLINERV